MEIIRLEEVKQYADKMGTERNEWVGCVIDMMLLGTHAVQYRNGDGHLVTIDMEYIHSHMQSLKGFDEAFNIFMTKSNDFPLIELRKKQLMLTIGELADDWEIGAA